MPNSNSGSSPRLVQSRSTNDTTTGKTTSLAYTSNLTATNLLIAACIWNSGTQTCTVASTANSSWTAIGSAQRGTGALNGWSVQLFYKLNCAGGADTVTMTCSANNTNRALAIHEVDGCDYASALEASTYSGNVTASGGIITTASGITPVTPTTFLFCAALVDNTVSAAGTGYTLAENANFGSNGTEYRVRYATGTYTASFSMTTTNASMILVAFKHTAAVLTTPDNNIILQPYNGGTGPHTASAGTELVLAANELVEVDTGILPTNRVGYFECVVKTSVSLANIIRLHGHDNGGVTTWDNDITGVEIPTGTTSATLFRSEYFIIPQSQKFDFYPIISAASGGTTTIVAWRVHVIQGSGGNPLWMSETHIEIGDLETLSNTTAAPLTNPKYWTYNAANWDGTMRIWAMLGISGTGGTATVTLQQDNGSFASWADLVTLFNTTTGSRTDGFTVFTPTDGRHYRLSAKTTTGSYTIHNCTIVVGQYEGATVGNPGNYGFFVTIQGGTATSAQTTQAAAQSFVLTKPANLTGVTLALKKVGAPTDNVVVDIVSSLGGSSLANGTLAASGLTTSSANYTINFTTSFVPTINTTYYVQITRSGIRDATNYIQAERSAFDDSPGAASSRDNNVWTQITGPVQVIMNLKGVSGINKAEIQWHLLNTGDAGTGLQGMPIKWVASEWSRDVSTTFKYLHDATNAADSSKLQIIPAGTDIANATVTGANEQLAGVSFVMPTDGSQIDVNVTNSTGIVTNGRIVILVNIIPGAAFINVNQAVRRAAFW